MGQGRHRKPTDTTGTLKKISLATTVGLGAVAAPAALSTPAQAATGAEWDSIAKCESGGRWDLPYGDADSTGGLQIQDRTWADFGGTAIAPHAYQATREQQIQIAEKILAAQGPSAWAVNGKTTANGYCGTLSNTPYEGSAPAPAPTPTPKPTPPPAPKPSGDDGVYVVKAGDYLSKIATALKIEGGWQALYNLNREVIGDDPALIQPGMKLKLPLPKDPYEYSGLPTPNHSSPSAVPLQQALKKKGYMPSSVVENPNYGPKTQAAVAAFHKANPQFAESSYDVVIGPKGWAFLIGKTAPTPEGGPGTPVPPTQGDYVRPVPGGVIQPFHNPSSMYGLGYHTGVDLEASLGTPVKAVHGGTVVSINGAGSAYGNHVVIKHADGVYTLSAHLSSVAVHVGQTVSTGQVIGAAGSTGTSTGPHLHFELRNNPTQYAEGIFSDPIAWLKSHGVNY